LASDCPKGCFESCQARPLVLSFNGRPISNANSKLVEVKAGQLVTLAFVLSDGQQELFADQVMAPRTEEAIVSLEQKKQNVGQFFDQLMTLFSDDKQKTAELPITTTVLFGDGQSYQTEDLQGAVEHVYTCKTKTCLFETKLEAQDAALVSAISNELTTLTIKVSN